MNKACVIGWPIRHSRSPLIHNHWIRKFGLQGSYEKQPVTPDQLGTFFDRLRRGDYVGCNVTIPHKETALRFIDHLDIRVKRTGALNTVYRRGQTLYATSTDGNGFFENIRAQIPDINLRDAIICVLGAGGAARAIIDRLLEEKPKSIFVANRTLGRAQEIAQHFGPILRPARFDDLNEILPHSAMLVNTTSLGMAGHEPLNIPVELLPASAVVADIVYVPLKTSLIERAEQLGLHAVPGLGMLLHQAVTGFELWFGVKPEVTTELYSLVARDIEQEHKP